jgi:hypothetical protein
MIRKMTFRAWSSAVSVIYQGGPAATYTDGSLPRTSFPSEVLSVRVGDTRAGGGAGSGSRPEFLLILQDRIYRLQHLAGSRYQGFLGPHPLTETIVVVGDGRIANADVRLRHTFHQNPHHPVTVLRHPSVMYLPARVAYPRHESEVGAELLESSNLPMSTIMDMCRTAVCCPTPVT